MYACPVMVAVALALPPAFAIRLLANEAHLDGPRLATARSGFTKEGYVTDITAAKARAVWTVRAKAGVYLVRVRFATPSGAKGFGLSVDGLRSDAMFPDSHGTWSVQNAGRIVLRDGEHEIALERGWGGYDVDWIELTPAPGLRPLHKLSSRLVDPKASPEARALYRRLIQGYGRTTWSGQYDRADNDFVREKTGRTPAVFGGDLMDFSPSRLSYFVKNDEHPKDPVPDWIAAARAGQTLTLSWHWNAPFGLVDTKEHRWYSGFYTNATTFDVAKAMRDPDSEERKGIVRDLDAIAIQLKRLQDAGVPVLWRPLHEAEGSWFWWGAKGPEPAKWLYRFEFDRLTGLHGLHNLIWVWNSPKAEWYPGDDVVDVESVDLYPTDRRDPLSPSWDDLIARFDGRKPLALAEFPGAPDVARMRRLGVRWLYFVGWSGSVGPKSTLPEILRSTYTLPEVVTAR